MHRYAPSPSLHVRLHYGNECRECGSYQRDWLAPVRPRPRSAPGSAADLSRGSGFDEAQIDQTPEGGRSTQPVRVLSIGSTCAKPFQRGGWRSRGEVTGRRDGFEEDDS